MNKESYTPEIGYKWRYIKHRKGKQDILFSFLIMFQITYVSRKFNKIKRICKCYILARSKKY